MDGNGNMHMRNWGYYEPSTSLKGHLGLQLMPTTAEKSFLSTRSHQNVMMGANGGAYHHRVCGVSDSPIPMDYMRDAWINHRERYLNVLPAGNHHHHASFSLLSEAPATQPMQMFQQPASSKDERVAQIEESGAEVDVGDGRGAAPLGGAPQKKRSGSKTEKSPKAKKTRRAPRAPRDDCTPPVQRARLPKKSAEVVINGIDMDISSIPIPVCSCTGTPQQCYRWGSGGWQSACCTTVMSMYPLPMSTKRRGARIAGRKMSLGAFKKVLEKLASEGYNFSHPIDLRTRWAKHGTNKFVTIR